MYYQKKYEIYAIYSPGIQNQGRQHDQKSPKLEFQKSAKERMFPLKIYEALVSVGKLY